MIILKQGFSRVPGNSNLFSSKCVCFAEYTFSELVMEEFLSDIHLFSMNGPLIFEWRKVLCRDIEDAQWQRSACYTWMQSYSMFSNSFGIAWLVPTRMRVRHKQKRHNLRPNRYGQAVPLFCPGFGVESVSPLLVRYMTVRRKVILPLYFLNKFARYKIQLVG